MHSTIMAWTKTLKTQSERLYANCEKCYCTFDIKIYLIKISIRNIAIFRTRFSMSSTYLLVALAVKSSSQNLKQYEYTRGINIYWYLFPFAIKFNAFWKILLPPKTENVKMPSAAKAIRFVWCLLQSFADILYRNSFLTFQSGIWWDKQQKPKIIIYPCSDISRQMYENNFDIGLFRKILLSKNRSDTNLYISF